MSEKKNFSNLRHNSPTIENENVKLYEIGHTNDENHIHSNNLSVTYQVDDSIIYKSVEDNFSTIGSSLGESLRRDIKQENVQESFASGKQIGSNVNLNCDSEHLEIKDLFESKQS